MKLNNINMESIYRCMTCNFEGIRFYLVDGEVRSFCDEHASSLDIFNNRWGEISKEEASALLEQRRMILLDISQKLYDYKGRLKQRIDLFKSSHNTISCSLNVILDDELDRPRRLLETIDNRIQLLENYMVISAESAIQFLEDFRKDGLAGIINGYLDLNNEATEVDARYLLNILCEYHDFHPKEVQSLQEENRRLNSELILRHSELESLQQENRMLHTYLHAKSAELEQSKEEIERLNGELIIRNAGYERLQRQTSQHIELQSRIGWLQEVNRGLNIELQSRIADLTRLQEEIMRLNRELIARNAAYERLQEVIRKLDTELHARNEEVKRLKDDSKRLDIDLQPRNQELQRELDRKLSSYILRAEHEELVRDLQSLIAKLRSQLDLDANEVCLIPKNSQSVCAVAINSDTSKIYSAGLNKKVTIWNRHSNEIISTNCRFSHSKKITTIALAEDDKSIITGSDDGKIIVRSHNNHKSKEIQAHVGGVLSLKVTDDSRFIISGGSDKFIKIWNYSTTDCIKEFEGHEGPVNALDITPSFSFIVSGSIDCTARVWEVDEGYNQRHDINHKSAILAIAASKNDKFFLTGGRCTIIKVWSLDNGELLFSLEGHVGFIESLIVSWDNEYIVSGGGEGDKTIKIWSIQNRSIVDTIIGGVGKVHSLALSKDDRYILAGGDDKKRNVRLRYFLNARD